MIARSQWTDDTVNKVKKMKALLQVNEEFKKRFGRPVRVWYEKFCLPQGVDIDMANCDLLPCFIACSNTLLCMHSASWRERLWCLSEAGDFVLMNPDERLTKILLWPLDECEDDVDLENAVCGNPVDQKRLRDAIGQMPHNESVGWPPLHWMLLWGLPHGMWWALIVVVTGFGFLGGFPDLENECNVRGGFAPKTFEWLLYFGQTGKNSWFRAMFQRFEQLNAKAALKGYRKLVKELLSNTVVTPAMAEEHIFNGYAARCNSGPLMYNPPEYVGTRPSHLRQSTSAPAYVGTRPSQSCLF